jgi:hypothetical protein
MKSYPVPEKAKLRTILRSYASVFILGLATLASAIYAENWLATLTTSAALLILLSHSYLEAKLARLQDYMFQREMEQHDNEH